MARKFQEGFEGRSLDLLAGQVAGGDATIGITETAAYESIGYGLEMHAGSEVGSSSWVRLMVHPGLQAADAYLRMMMKVDLNGNTGRYDAWFDLLDDQGIAIYRVYLASAEHGMPGVPDGPFPMAPIFLTTDWIRWEFFMRVASPGMVFVRQNDVDKKYSYFDTALDGGVAFGGIQWYAIGDDISIFLDDIAYNDTVDAGRGNNTYPGLGKVIRLASVGVGSNSDYTPTPGTGEDNYEDVDDPIPDGATTRVTSGTIGHIDTYETEDLPTGYVVREGCVQVAVKANIPTDEIAVYSVDGGDSIEGRSMDVWESFGWATYRYFRDVLPTSPDGSEWTKELVDSAEFGFKSSA